MGRAGLPTAQRRGGCRSPLTASRCAKLVVAKHKLKEWASMEEVVAPRKVASLFDEEVGGGLVVTRI